MISDLMRAWLTASATGGISALLLFALKPLVKNRLPRSAQYSLWIAAIAVFLIPFSSIVTIPAAADIPTIGGVVQDRLLTGSEYRRQAVYEITGLAQSSSAEEAQKYSADELTAVIEAQEKAERTARILDFAFVLLPIIGFASLLTTLVLQYFRSAGILRRRNAPASDPELALLALLASLCGKRRAPRLYRNPLAETPLLLGLFRPAIILPDREYADEQLRCVLLHELTHLRRGDLYIKCLAAAVCAAHWFNPLAWLARRELDRACELSCDEAVIRGLDGPGRQSYGNTLIAVAADCKMPRAVLTVTMCEEKKSLKERLGAIMMYKKHTKRAIAASAVLLVAVALTACALGAGSGEAENRFPEATIGYEDKSAVLALGDREHIPYVELDSVISLNFGEKRPASVSVIEVIANADGSRKYDEATDKTLEVEYFGGNAVCFSVEKNFGDALSSNSDDYLPGNAFRWYRIVCSDKGNGDDEYGLWLRTDPGIIFARAPIDAPAAVLDLVKDFGRQFQWVRLDAPAPTPARGISEKYADFVTPELLKRWTDNPDLAPGRIGSSPWPDRIEITGAKKLSETEYAVSGTVIWISSAELRDGGAAHVQPIVLQVIKNDADRRIDDLHSENFTSAIERAIDVDLPAES